MEPHNEGKEKSIEMRLAAIEDKLGKLLLSDEEVSAIQKQGTEADFIPLLCVRCVSCVRCARCSCGGRCSRCSCAQCGQCIAAVPSAYYFQHDYYDFGY